MQGESDVSGGMWKSTGRRKTENKTAKDEFTTLNIKKKEKMKRGRKRKGKRSLFLFKSILSQNYLKCNVVVDYSVMDSRSEGLEN